MSPNATMEPYGIDIALETYQDLVTCQLDQFSVGFGLFVNTSKFILPSNKTTSDLSYSAEEIEYIQALNKQ